MDDLSPLGEPAFWVPQPPSEAREVERVLGLAPGALTLVATRSTRLWRAWLWSDAAGLGYFSKAPLVGRAHAWATGRGVEQLLRANRALVRVSNEELNGKDE